MDNSDKLNPTTITEEDFGSSFLWEEHGIQEIAAKEESRLEKDTGENEFENWKHDSTAWLKRARAKTAQSSRKSRQKRKQDEETIISENKKLKQDRAKCLAEIEKLEAEIRKYRFDSGRPLFLGLENEWLRVQLEEHRKFIHSFSQMSEQIPGNDGDIDAKVVASATREEVDMTITLINALLSQSATWKPIMLEPTRFKYLTPKHDLSACFRMMPVDGNKDKILYARIDLVFPWTYADTVVEVYWKSYVEERSFRQFFGDPVDGSFKFPFILKPLSFASKSNLIPIIADPGENADIDKDFQVLFYRELRPNCESDRFANYVCTKKSTTAARSTLLLPSKLGPKLAQHAPSGKKSASRVYGKTKATILARSRMLPIPMNKLDQVTKGASCATNLRFDGAFVWDEENIIDKELVPCARWACVLQMKEGLGQQVLDKFTDLVTETGHLHPRICAALDRFVQAVRTRSKPTNA